MRRRVWHPSRRRLKGWLDHGDASLDVHLTTCERCATRLEDMSQPAGSLGDALRTMLAPPADLHPRLRAGISRKVQTREDLKLLFELMGIPWQTAQAMQPPPPDPGHRS